MSETDLPNPRDAVEDRLADGLEHVLPLVPRHGPRSWVWESLLLPSEREVEPAHRGFHAWEGGPSITEPVGRAFLSGYRAGLRARHTMEAAAAVQQLVPRWRGFAMEGLAMAAGIRDGLRPGGRHFATLMLHSGERHVYMNHVGLGWSLARLPRLAWPRLHRFDPLVAPLILDGFGFHETFFATERVLARRAVDFPLASRWPGTVQDGEQQLAQGVGRALWFVGGGSPALVHDIILSFREPLRDSLWAGVGLAATYAGGRGPQTLRTLRDAAGHHAPWLAQGAVFAVEARVRAGTLVPHTVTAGEVLAGLDPAGAAALARHTQPDAARVDAGDWSVYEQWRSAIASAVSEARTPT